MPLPGALYTEAPIDPKTGRFTRAWLLYLNGLSSAGGGTPSAPANAEFVIYAPNGALPNARVATSDTEIAVDIATLGQIKWLLQTTTVTPGTYGDATHVAQFTVDSKGRLTFAADVPINPSLISGYWTELTNGDGTTPELIFDSFGDTIDFFVP